MLILERITTLYAQGPDRISLNASDKGGAVTRIWLTRRLVTLLVPELVKVVKPSHDDVNYAAVLAGVAQQRAIQHQQPEAPVLFDRSGGEWLVAKIDLKFAPAGVVLTFSGTEGQAAQFAMNAELLHQWLAILKRLCDSADWNFPWPDWIGPSVPKTATATVLH